jgi:hypothetical protein
MKRQFVIQLENRPGELGHIARALGARGINIEQISCAGTGPIACAFVTTGDEADTRAVIQGLGHEFLEGDTVVVDVLDKPEALADVADQLTAAGVKIYGTMTVGRREGIQEIAFAVDDGKKARAALPAAELASIG